MLMRNVALVFCCAIFCAPAQGQEPAATPSIVYAVHDPDSIQQYKTNPGVVREMVNRLVLAVTGQSDVARESESRFARQAASFSRPTTPS